MASNVFEYRRESKTIIIAFQVGGLEAYKIDKDLSLKYGIDPCVGDTLNAGGILGPPVRSSR